MGADKSKQSVTMPFYLFFFFCFFRRQEESCAGNWKILKKKTKKRREKTKLESVDSRTRIGFEETDNLSEN